MPEDFYRLDERENAVDYLETTATYLSGVHPHKWKWITISLHSALYAFAILAIQGTDPDRVKKPKKLKSKQFLINAREALDRCQSDVYMHQRSGSKKLTLSSGQRDVIQLLSKVFRDNFVHFLPKSWSIEVSGFPHIVREVSQVIEFLAFRSGNVDLTIEQINRTQQALKVLMAQTNG